MTTLKHGISTVTITHTVSYRYPHVLANGCIGRLSGTDTGEPHQGGIRGVYSQQYLAEVVVL